MGAAMIPMLALSACSDKGDDPAPGDNGDNPAASADGRFVFATTVQGSNARASMREPYRPSTTVCSTMVPHSGYSIKIIFMP